ncbi:MAG: 4-hydroxy-tetrahydrodipicolinate reductase [Cytophagaceae bacterium]|nr:4-hydroxy-tetrahydrodipicolinate reductase [Cytophagaceae bacterium]
MRIILLGYGKMGKVIEGLALERGHTIVARIDEANRAEFDQYSPDTADVVIEFSHPDAAVQNLRDCLTLGLPVVCGTTGWLDHRAEIEELCHQRNGAFFYASNYSIGVNLFFRLNRTLARLMARQSQYRVTMTETHHVHKLDAPSGTALTLAEGILAHVPRYTTWVLGAESAENELPIISLREGEVPGTHAIKYSSGVDDLEIIHTAYSREGFALGAVVAAEWLAGRHGIFSMDDLLGEEPR